MTPVLIREPGEVFPDEQWPCEEPVCAWICPDDCIKHPCGEPVAFVRYGGDARGGCAATTGAPSKEHRSR